MYICVRSCVCVHARAGIFTSYIRLICDYVLVGVLVTRPAPHQTFLVRRVKPVGIFYYKEVSKGGYTFLYR